MLLINLAIIFIIGVILGKICTKLKLPSLIGYLISGLLLGDVFHILSDDFMLLSADFRRLALIVILLRAGLSLDFSALKKVGRPAILLCFLPASFEIVGFTLLSPVFLGLSMLEGALLGSVIAAVSPAVIVPRMLSFIDKKWGTNHAVPQMILAGASVDDVFVLVMFSGFSAMVGGGTFSPKLLLNIPISIILGVLIGIIIGFVLSFILSKINLANCPSILILLSTGFLLMAFEDAALFPFSGMLAIMAMGGVIQLKLPDLTQSITAPLGEVWSASEILLFTLVGAAAKLTYVMNSGAAALLLIICALIFRMAGTAVSVAGTSLNKNERLFTMIAYCPKATVQAAIGGVPLALGFACGDTVLTCAVIAIFVTAPLGAFAIDKTASKLLQKD